MAEGVPSATSGVTIDCPADASCSGDLSSEVVSSTTGSSAVSATACSPVVGGALPSVFIDSSTSMVLSSKDHPLEVI